MSNPDTTERVCAGCDERIHWDNGMATFRCTCGAGWKWKKSTSMSDKTTLPAGRLIRIEFEARLPQSATKEQVAEWVAFELGFGSMSLINPLSDHDLEYCGRLPSLTDTGRGATNDGL